MMKTIIVPTDFSEPAENAALYALNLAFYTNANIYLCHALRPEGPDPSLGGISQAVKNFPEMREICETKLKQLISMLETESEHILAQITGDYKPVIAGGCDFGDISAVVLAAAEGKDIPMIVMGRTGAGKLNRLAFGNSTLHMIKRTKLPLLIIPYTYKFGTINKIAYSCEMTEDDKRTSQSLADFAASFDAEMLIAHIPNFVEMIDSREYHTRQKTFMQDLEGKVSFKSIESDNIDSGLENLKKEDIDMLVMGHENRGFLDRFIFGSYAARHAAKIGIPLLIIPKRFAPQF